MSNSEKSPKSCKSKDLQLHGNARFEKSAQLHERKKQLASFLLMSGLQFRQWQVASAANRQTSKVSEDNGHEESKQQQESPRRKEANEESPR